MARPVTPKEDFRPRAAAAVKNINPRMPKRETMSIEPPPQSDLLKALGVELSADPASYYSGAGSTTWTPAAPMQEWRQQHAHDTMVANLDWQGKLAYDVGSAMTEGPFATALEYLLKPLTVAVTGTRLLVENVLRKRPEEGGLSWGDAWDKIGGTYTFGEMLADYDIWQEPENLKWARMAGFAGDVALDPLTWLGLVGKAIGIGAKLTGEGARVISGHAVRNAIIAHVGDDAGKVFGGIFRNTRLLDDNVMRGVADDLVKGTDNFVTRVSDDVVELDLNKLGGVVGPTDPLDTSLIMTLDNALIDDITKLYDAGARAIRRGATAVTDDEMRIAARHIAASQLDNSLRSPSQIATRAVDDVTAGTTRGYTNPWIVADEVEDLTFAFGWRVPFTGRVGKAIFRHKLQQPIGLKFWGSNTRAPFIGTWVRGVPQAARTVFFGRNIIGKGPVAKAAQMAGKATQEKVGTGYGGLIGWMKRGGRAPEIRQLMKTAMQEGDAVGVHHMKAFLHAAGRGDMAGRVVRQEMLRKVDAFFKEADVAGANSADLYHAIAGSEDAAARVGQELTDKGRLLMRDLRQSANEHGGQNFLGHSSDYVPRVLSEEARTYLEAKGRGLVNRSHKGHAYKESGFEQTRSYISKEEFDFLVDAQVAKGASPAEADAAVRASGRQHDFLGEDLYKAGSEMPSGEIAQDVEKQIADIMERHAISYSLFDEDLRVALSAYVDAISKRVGEVFTDTLMKKQGIFFDRTAMAVHIPDLRMTDAVMDVRSAASTLLRAETDLDHKLKVAIERFGKDQADAADSVVEARETLRVADESYKRAVEAHDVKAQEFLLLEQEVMFIEKRILDLEGRERGLRVDMEGAPFERLVEMEREVQEIVKVLDDLYKSKPMFELELSRLRASTYAVLTLEDKIYTVFGDQKTFEKFVGAFDEYVGGSVDEYAMAAARDGKKGFTPIRDTVAPAEAGVVDEAGNVVYQQASDVVGWELKVGDRVINSDEATQMLGNVEAIIADLDGTGLANWLGLEMHVRAKDATGIASSLSQVESARTILTDQVKRAVERLEKGIQHLGPDELVGSIPSPMNVTDSKRLMLTKLDELWKQANDPASNMLWDDIWPTVMKDPEFVNAASTYYGVFGDSRAVTTIPDGLALDQYIETAKISLRARAQHLETQLADAPVITATTPEGLIYENLTISDVVYIMRFQNEIIRAPHGSQMPFATDNIPISKLFADGEITGGWQGSGGMAFAEDAGSDLGVKGGSNEGYKIKYTLADGTIKRFYVKKYVDVAGSYPSGATADAARHRVSGEVLADRLYNEIVTGSAPASWYGQVDEGQFAGIWKATDWEDELVQGIHVPMTHQYREKMADGTYRIVQTYSEHPYGAIYDDVHDYITPETLDLTVHTPMSDLVGDQMATDMLIGNLDAVGFAGDNIGVNKMTGEVFRLDNGSAFHYRAQGELKGGSYDYRNVDEITGFFDLAFEGNQAKTISMWRQFRSTFDDVEGGIGMAAELSRQTDRLLAARTANGGWAKWVRKQLPDAPEEDIHMFVDWLETRTQKMAEQFGLTYNTGDDMIGEALARTGVGPAQIDEALTGTYGATQRTSERLGLRAWLSPKGGMSGVPESQALESFTITDAIDELLRNADNVGSQARDVEVVRHLWDLRESGILQRMLASRHALDIDDPTLMHAMFRSEIDETTFAAAEAGPKQASDVEDWMAQLSGDDLIEAQMLMKGQETPAGTVDEALPPLSHPFWKDPDVADTVSQFGRDAVEPEDYASWKIAEQQHEVAWNVEAGYKSAPEASAIRATEFLPKTADEVPWEQATNRYGVVIMDGVDSVYLRMPTNDPLTGQIDGGNRWTHSYGMQTRTAGMADENPMQVAVREAYEQTGLDVELVGFVPEVFHGAEQTHYFVGRVRAGTSSGRTVPTSDPQVHNQLLRLNHASGHGGYFAPHWLLGTNSANWIDQSAPNANIMAVVYDMVSSRYQHQFRVNLPHGASSIKVYGLPAHDRLRAAEAIVKQADGLDPRVPEQLTRLQGLQGEIENLLSGEGNAAGLFGTEGQYSHATTEHGQFDMMFDMYERVRDVDPDLWEGLLHDWRAGRAINTIEENTAASQKIKQGAKVVDTVTALEARGVFPEGMSWRHKMTFIGWLNTNSAYDGNIRSALHAMHDGVSVPLAQNPLQSLILTVEAAGGNLSRYEMYTKGLDNLAAQPTAQLKEDVLTFIASISNDSSKVGSGFSNRFDAEGAQVLNPFLGPQDRTGGRNILVQMGEYAHQFGAQHARETGPMAARATFKPIDTVQQYGGPLYTGRTRGWATAETPSHVPPDPTVLGGPTPRSPYAQEQLRAAVRTHARFLEAYRRSLSSGSLASDNNGYAVSVWFNQESARWNTAQGHSDNPTLANFMLTNPRAIMPDTIHTGGLVSELDKFRGQTGTRGSAEHDVFMNAEQFLKEYEEMANAQFVPREFDEAQQPDLLAALQQEKAEVLLDRDAANKALVLSRSELQTARNQVDALKKQRDWGRDHFDRADAALDLADERVAHAVKAQEQLEALRVSAAATPDDELADIFKDIAVAVSHIHMVTVNQVDQSISNALAWSIQGPKTVKAGARPSDYKHQARIMDGIFGEVGFPPSEVSEVGKDLQAGLEGIAKIRAGKAEGPFDTFVSDDEFWFPLRDFADREEVLEQLWMSGYKAFGSNSQGPEAMVEAMTAVTRFNAQGGWGEFLRHYDKVHNLLKGYMIAKPGFHMRNFFSATFMNFLHGVKFSSYRQFQRAYWKFQHDLAVEQGMTRRADSMKASMKKRGIWNNVNADDVAIVREMYEGNILGGSSGQVAAEFLQSPLEQGGFRRAWGTVNPFNSRNAPLRLSRNVGVGTETYVRGVLGFDVLKHSNGTVDDAFDAITKWHFDYSDLSAFESKVIKRLVPFYTWTKHALPLMIEQVGKNPAKMSMYLKAKRNIEHGQEKAGIVPPYFLRQGAIQLPFKFKGENMFVLPDLPFKTPLELIDPALALDKDMSVTDRIQVMLGSVGTQITPLIKAPYEWKAKQNLWKGYNFDGRYQQVPTAYRNIPLLMPMLDALGLAEKQNDVWLMRDYELHTMGQLLPTFTDMRRLFPSEERYQQRTLSTWMSFAFGMGLRTNTLEEQRRVIESAYWQQVEKMGDMRQLLQESQNENP